MGQKLRTDKIRSYCCFYNPSEIYVEMC